MLLACLLWETAIPFDSWGSSTPNFKNFLDLNVPKPGLNLNEAFALTQPAAGEVGEAGDAFSGVVLSEAVAMARTGGPIRIELGRTWLVVACLVALVVFPAVWREIGALAEATLLVQMGVAAQGGVFWGVVLAGAEKGVAG